MAMYGLPSSCSFQFIRSRKRFKNASTSQYCVKNPSCKIRLTSECRKLFKNPSCKIRLTSECRKLFKKRFSSPLSLRIKIK